MDAGLRLRAPYAAGVQQAVDAFYRNDPYFPRPWANIYTDEDNKVWEVFRREFLKRSDEILGTDETIVAARRIDQVSKGDLAWPWIVGIEREGRRRMEAQAEQDQKESARRVVTGIDTV